MIADDVSIKTRRSIPMKRMKNKNYIRQQQRQNKRILKKEALGFFLGVKFHIRNGVD